MLIYEFSEYHTLCLYLSSETKQIFGFGFTFYKESLLFGVQSINRVARSSNQMSCRRNQEAHSGLFDDILEKHISISLDHKRLVEKGKIRQQDPNSQNF